MDLDRVLRDTKDVTDLPKLVAMLGHRPLWDEIPPDSWPERGRRGGHAAPRPAFTAGVAGEFPWFALQTDAPARDARSVAGRLKAMGRLGGVLAIDPLERRLAVAVAFDHVPVLDVDLRAPDPAAVASLARLGGLPEGGPLAYAARAAEALSAETVGRRFFREFRDVLFRMAAGLPGPMRADDRHSLALLQLTRVLFIYFIQTKGWLAGRERFLAEELDRCLARRRRVHRDLLRPLFFGTLNRPIGERGRIAAEFGAMPFLNGGLFEPHPLERRHRADIPDALWRDAFDRLFERFHFTVAERDRRGAVAPDMLGRVFEGVMDPDARRSSGTFYTPAALVERVLDAGLAALLAERLSGGAASAAEVIDSLTLLDPAVGSGAFLLGALERLAALSGASGAELAARKRRILQRNLFGVDRSATAVRLTELRLWLAVIADDPAERAEQVTPLPNLDCLVRQGDSLFEPAATAGTRPAAAVANELAALRARTITATGPAKTALLRRLRAAEARALDESLAEAEGRLRSEVAGCLRDARGSDLFGHRRGLDRALRDRLCGLRAEMREIRRARRLARDGDVPWFHYRSHFADVFARGGFDLVVGNPPWLRAEEIPPETRRRLEGRYRWWRSPSGGYGNRPDLAVAFLERAFELAAPGGAVALLVPAKLASATYGAAARHSLAGEATLHVVADLTGDPAAAFDATVYPLALVATRTPPPSGHRVCTALVTRAKNTVAQTDLGGGGPWILVPDDARDALTFLRREHPRFDERFACHLGVKTGANGVFLDPPGDIEPEVLRWAVRGRDLAPFRAEPKSRLLWTHGPGGRPREELPPRAAAYLEPYHAVLRARTDFDGGPPWAVFRAGPAAALHRVVWADLARRLTAAALTGAADQELIPLNTCYVAVAGSAAEARLLTAWLNSTWVRAAARAGATPASGGFARFNGAVVGGVPLPPSVLTDEDLPALAEAGRRGEPVQEELDAIAARHLGLSAAAQTALRALVGARPDDRR